MCKWNEIFVKFINDEAISKEKRESFQRLLDFTLDRDIIKRSIMTIPYNAKDYAMAAHMKDTLKVFDIVSNDTDSNKKEYWYRKLNSIDDEKNPKINKKDLLNLVNTFRIVIENESLKIKKLIKYLDNIAKICSILGYL